MKKIFLLFLSLNVCAVDLYLNKFNTDKAFFESVSTPDVYDIKSLSIYNKIGKQTSSVDKVNELFFLNTGFNLGIYKSLDISANFHILKDQNEFNFSDGLFEFKKQFSNNFATSLLFLPTIGETQYINSSSHRFGVKFIGKETFFDEYFYWNLTLIKSLKDNYFNHYKQNNQGLISLAHRYNIKDGVSLNNEVVYSFMDTSSFIYIPQITYDFESFIIRNGVELETKLRTFSMFFAVEAEFERVFDSVLSDEYPIMSTYDEALEEKIEEEKKNKELELRESIKAELKAEIMAAIQNDLEKREEQKKINNEQFEKIKSVKYKLELAQNKMNENIQLFENRQMDEKEALKEISWGLRVINLRKNYINKLRNEYESTNNISITEDLGNINGNKELEEKAKTIISMIKKNNIKKIEIVNDNIEENQKKMWKEFKTNSVGTILQEKQKIQEVQNITTNETSDKKIDITEPPVQIEVVSIQNNVKVEDHFKVKDVKSMLQNLLELKKNNIEKSEKVNNVKEVKDNIIKVENPLPSSDNKPIDNVIVDNTETKKVEKMKTLDQKLEDVADDFEILSIENDSTDIKMDSFIQKSNGPAF